MTDDLEWSEVDETPKKKRGIPTWVWWGCGGGCLLAVAVLIVVGIFVGSFVKKIADPEYAKEQIQKLIPYDEWPEGDEARGGGAFGTYTFVVMTDRIDGYQFQVRRMPSMGELDDLFEEKSMANRGFFGIGKIADVELGTIEVQGRETRCMWYTAWMPDEDIEAGASLRVDLTGEGTTPVCIDVIAMLDVERIEEDVLRAFLEPFDVWRGK